MAATPLQQFIGQKQLTRTLGTLVAGAQSRGEALPHILLVGPSGVGKTLLAKQVAREYSNTGATASITNLIHLVAGPDVTVRAVVKILVSLPAFSIVFVDEVHGLRPDVQECLYLALDELRTYSICEDGSLDRATLSSVAAFTLIAASNMPGKIRKALRARLHVFHFEAYSVDEIRRISERIAEERQIDITTQALRFIADRSRSSPREARKLLELVRVGCPRARLELPAVRLFLNERGIDDHGLDITQRLALRHLAAARSHSLSHEVLATKLGMDSPYVRQEVEPFLVQQELIDIVASNRRRRITSAGLAIVQQDAQRSEAVPAADDGAASVVPPRIDGSLEHQQIAPHQETRESDERCALPAQAATQDNGTTEVRPW